MIFYNKKLGKKTTGSSGVRPVTSQTQKNTYCLISFLSSSGTGKPAPGVKVTFGWQGAGRTGREHVMVSDVPGTLRVGCQKTRKFTELCLTICAPLFIFAMLQ